MPSHSPPQFKTAHGGTTYADAIKARRAVRPLLRPGAALAKPVFRAIAAPPTPAPIAQQCCGSGFDVILQGFHWTSWQSQNPNWYQILAQNAGRIKTAQFDLVWFPPPSDSAFHAQGYMPTLWNVLDTSYGASTDLTAAIQALAPVKALADVVVNHRCGAQTGGADFSDPPFTDQTGAICKDDESGAGTGNFDTGEHQAAARDLDHTSLQVRTAIETYLGFLKTTGFSSWRYDEARGFAGEYVGEYNDESKPYLSVGEFWDSDRQTVIDWVDSTAGRSMAFDFPTRTLLKSALNNRQFWLLKTIDGKPTGAIGFWPNMCVTFIEDHDTAKDHPDPDEFGNGDQVLQGYAYILTHPGVPCVFWSHFFDYGPLIQDKITSLIAVRKRQNLSSSSIVNIAAADDGKYAAIIDNKVAVKLGPAPWDPGTGWTVSVDGNDFAVWEI